MRAASTSLLTVNFSDVSIFFTTSEGTSEPLIVLVLISQKLLRSFETFEKFSKLLRSNALLNGSLCVLPTF